MYEKIRLQVYKTSFIFVKVKSLRG